MKNQVRVCVCASIFLSIILQVWGENRLVPSVYPTIQAGIDAAVDGDTVLIADGTYRGVGNRDIDFGGKAITVRSENGAGVCIVDGQDINNCFGFRFDSSEPDSAVLDGVTIANCYQGVIIAGAEPTIRNCRITPFHWAGINCSNGAMQVENCQVKLGHQSYNYAGIVLENSSATIVSTDVTDVYSGRGIKASGSRLEMDDCLIARNNAYSDYVGGGGICFQSFDPQQSLILRNCTITNNLARGADSYETMMCDPPGCIMGEPGCNCMLVCLNSPTDGRGGGIYFGTYGGGEMLLFNCLVTQNMAESGYRFGSTCYGEAQAYGGGIYIERPYGFTSPDPELINCTVADNQAYKGVSGWGSEMRYCEGGGVYWSGDSACQVTNCIVWNNLASREYPEMNEELRHQLYGNFVQTATVVQYGNWSVDPGFASGPLGTYYLNFGSSCINAGDNTSQNYGLESLTTSIDNYPDFGQVDLGYHYVISEQPSLALLSPNGGEAFISTKQYPIQWQSTGSVRNVKIEYSTNGGGYWIEVSPPNSGDLGTYLWTVPSLNSNQCLVRVTEPSLAGVTDTSDDAFTIFICHLAADLTNDCVINLDDFTLLASEWLESGNPFE